MREIVHGSSEPAGETSAFLNEALGRDDGDVATISTLGGEEWDPYLLLEAMDGQYAGDDQQEETKKKKRRTKQLHPNKAREERRFQLIQLREEVEELEWTLKRWQDVRGTRARSAKEKEAIVDGDSDAPAVWEEICGRQVQRRLKAERENFRLKQQVEEEMQLVKSIEKMLFRRLMVQEMVPSEARKCLRRTNLPPGYIQRMASALFEELSAGIEVCYYLGANTPIPANVRPHTPLLRSGLKSEERMFFDKRVVPFSMEAASDAWWRNWYSYRGHASENAGDVVAESFGLEMNDFRSKSSVTCYGQQILHREAEGTRTLFIWNTYLEPFQFDGVQVKGIYFLEQCQMIIKPEDDVEQGETSAQMSGCYVVTPYFLDLALRTDPKAGDLIDFLVGTLFSNMETQNDAVEDLLLDQVLQKYN
ncbi:ATP-binding cassette (ABC) Superfamily [Phytophthora cinnamomi]|uniref:ATP-binding cassette (ABC) Superfamily n=1 Tax=Phytophthora cinnamomi TaxID=4785 RepID=UPI00355ABA1E|nr:ATP-binding cassette (ABC) Superfamily [Phytophthora cinnamomi]